MDVAATGTTAAQPDVAGEEGFHPSYSSQNATLVIASRDGVKFRVHPIMLQMASEVFSNMLAQATDTGEAVVLHERSHTVKSMLDFIYPNAPYFDLEEEKFHSIWNLLIAAEKYIIAKIFSEFRKRISNDKYFSSNPIQAYVIATRFGWNDVARECSLSAIDHLQKEKHYIDLIHVDSKSIMRLHKFADMCRKASMSVLRDVLEDYYDIHMSDDDTWAFKTQHIVESCAMRSLHDYPSGKRLIEDLRIDCLTEYLLEGWEDAYLDALQHAIGRVDGGFPKRVDEIELDAKEELID